MCGGNPWCSAFWGQGAFLAGPVSRAGPRLLWHGCGLPLARDSLAQGGGGGLPGSRDEDAQPGRLGSSLVTRVPVCCKQSRGQREKKGRRGTKTCLPPSLQIPEPANFRTKRKKPGLGWGMPGFSEASWDWIMEE